MKSVDLRLLLSSSSGRRLLIASVFAGVFWSAIVVGNAYLISEIIVRIIGHKPRSLHFIALLAGLWLLRAVFQSSFDYWCSVQAIRMKQELRSETTSKAENYSAGSAAGLSNILTKGLNALDIYLGRFVPQMIFAAITPTVVIVTLFTEDLISGFIALITLPLIPLFGALIGRFSEEAVVKKWQTLGTLSAYFEDSLRGFITLKIFGRSKSQSKRIGQMGDTYADETMKVLRISFLSAFALELISTLSVAVIAVSIGLRLVSGSLDFKTALVVLVLAPEVYFPVRNAASLFHASQDGTQSLRELEQVRRQPSSTPTSENLPSLEIIGLSWPSWKFLNEVTIGNARIQRGQMLFVIGDSGVGKTTFASNVLGFSFDAPIEIHADKGDFTLGAGMHTQWQKLVGWIPQNPQLAAGSLRQQFVLIDSNATDAQIENALSMAGLSIGDLPDGLDTNLGQGGEASHSASGGQIRRIAVARALFRNPLLLVADEPTADLDVVSSTLVMKALRSAQSRGAMVICITHDSALVGPDDLVCAVERGAE